MSQKKVDYYKEQKANRSKIIKKEKRMLALEKTIGVLVLVAAIAWICFSVYMKVNVSKQPEDTVAKNTVMDVTSLSDYMNGVSETASLAEADEEELVVDVDEETAAEEITVTEDEETAAEETAEADATPAAETSAAEETPEVTETPAAEETVEE